MLQLAGEKGSSSWLNAPPIKSLGFTLNKREFRDSIHLRYGWAIPGTPTYCQCGESNSINHALSCNKGGYGIMRHNHIRDVEAELLNEVCKDVRIEPPLLPVSGEKSGNGNNADGARLDVSAIGVWAPLERSFMDVRIFHPNAPSYEKRDISKLYETHEKEKKKAYNERVIQNEKGSFTPLVMTTTGGMGIEAQNFHKRLALLIANKRKEAYSDVILYIRTKIRFAILKCTLIAIRGIRNKTHKSETTPISNVSFNLIDF